MAEDHSFEGSSLERAGYLDRGIDGWEAAAST
jgi:hypothetical protein